MNVGIIFDLDGTLWNATKEIADSWNVIFKKYPEVDFTLTTEGLKNEMGKMMEKIADDLLPEIPQKKRYEILEKCCSYENEYIAQNGGKLYEGVEDTLKELSKKYKVFMVSNCQDGYIEAFLKVNGFSKYITDFENPGRTSLPKSENIKLVVERNNIDKAFYVGDTQGDYDSTMEAGIEFIFAAYGFGKINGDTPKIDSLSELPEVIEKLIEK